MAVNEPKNGLENGEKGEQNENIDPNIDKLEEIN